MRLMELHPRLSGVELHGDVPRELTGVTHDSRRIQPGDVFVAIRGQKTDGNQFVESALKRDSGQKDSGQVVPAFGGLLDLMDSPLLAAPIAWWLLTFWPAVG